MTQLNSQKHRDTVSLPRKEHSNFQTQLEIYCALSMIEHKKKKQVIDQMSADLVTHLEVDGKIRYPEVKTHMMALAEIMNQGVVEHIRLRFLLKQLKSMTGNDSSFDAHIQRLSKALGKHVDNACSPSDTFLG